MRQGDYLGALDERNTMEEIVSNASGINLYDVRTFTSYGKAEGEIAAFLNSAKV